MRKLSGLFVCGLKYSPRRYEDTEESKYLKNVVLSIQGMQAIPKDFEPLGMPAKPPI
jgi:hypothetical protein